MVRNKRTRNMSYPTEIPMPVRRYTCPDCGSHEVLRDAHAIYDDELKDFVLHSVYDTFSCNGCGHYDITPKDNYENT
jgi:transcription elongation factor Elf1